MRQPKYEMGERVMIPIHVKNDVLGYVTIVIVNGIVVGVQYDPKDGTNGWPYYKYTIMLDNSKGCIKVDEKDITSYPGQAGKEE